MNPEDPTQYDALASKLSALQPVSAGQLQAQAFYEAGRRASGSQPAPTLLKLRSLAASLALVLVSSTAAYYAGSQHSGPLNSDISDNLAVVELTQPKSPHTSATIRTDVAQPMPIVDEPVHRQPASEREPARQNSGAQAVTPLLASWFQLPYRDAEEYWRSIELRTRPVVSRSPVMAEPPSDTVGPTSRSPSSLQGQLPELDRLQFDSPLRKWLSM